MWDWRECLRSDENHACVAGKVVSAVNRLLKHDAYLLKKNASERSITHRLAVYLEQEFPGWHVDCEYNRDDHRPKAVDLPEESEQEKCQKKKLDGGSLVLPDIIVHHRGKDKRENLLVIEAKKSTGDPSNERDMKKLQAYKDKLEYQHALFLKFACGTGNAGVDQGTMWV